MSMVGMIFLGGWDAGGGVIFVFVGFVVCWVRVLAGLELGEWIQFVHEFVGRKH